MNKRNNELKISVVVPNYNHASYLQQRLTSIYNQTYSNFEVIIIDDASTDGSRDIIEQYRAHPKTKQIIYNDVNTGTPFRQWRTGIEYSLGDYIWIAESDDWAAETFLLTLTSSLQNHTNIGICFCGSNWVNERGEAGQDLSIYSDGFFRPGKEEIRKHMVKYCTVQNASATLIKTELAKKYTKAIVDYKACGDWLMYLNVLNNSNVLFVGQKLNNFRWYHNNVSNNASNNGTWITEGLKVLLFSKAYQVNYSRIELKDILNYWLAKTDQFKFPRKQKLKQMTRFYFFLFVCRQFLWANNRAN